MQDLSMMLHCSKNRGETLKVHDPLPESQYPNLFSLSPLSQRAYLASHKESNVPEDKGSDDVEGRSESCCILSRPTFEFAVSFATTQFR